MNKESSAREAGQCPVLIVGAGPVGLVVAGELLRRGVPVRVVDRQQRSSNASKATLIWPRSLELLEGLGVSHRMLDTGHPVDGVRFYSSGSVLGSVLLTKLADTSYKHVLMLPQHHTERILLQRFTELGGQVEWNVDVTEVREDAAGVTTTLRRDTGEQEVIRSRWLVGADGAHSTVRRQLGVDYHVTSPNSHFAIADAPVTGDLDQSVLHYFYSGHGSLAVGSLGAGIFRFAISVPPGTEPSRELFQQAVDLRASAVGSVGEPRWSATFTVRCATAGRFRTRRSFLVGDAAHVLSPAGGQGLNTGIQDGVNLGWKLAGVCQSILREEILDSYDSERRAAVLRVAATTDRQTRWGLLKTPVRIALRDTVVRAAEASGLMQRALAPMFSQTDLSYGKAQSLWSLLAGSGPQVRVGGRLPFLAHMAGTETGTADTVLPLLIVSPGQLAGSDWAVIRERLARDVAVSLPTLDLAEQPGDSYRALRELLGSRPTAVLVRRDGHVLAVAPAERPAPLREALAVMLAAPCSGPAGPRPADLESADLEPRHAV
jgi:2-polyprenyl-6-methoxyphenol hydroxylase-like FAD-dependent oxidoreductase